MKKPKKQPKPQLDMFGGFEEKASFEIYNAGQKPKGEPSAKLLENYCSHRNMEFIKTKFLKETEMPIINVQKTYGSVKAFTRNRKSGIKTFKHLELKHKKCRPIEWRTTLSKFFFNKSNDK